MFDEFTGLDAKKKVRKTDQTAAVVSRSVRDQLAGAQALADAISDILAAIH